MNNWSVLAQCYYLFWFGLDKCQMPTKTALSLSSAGQERGNMMKVSRVKIRTGRDPSAVTVTDKTDWIWGEKKKIITDQITAIQWEIKLNLQTPSPYPSLHPRLSFTTISLPPPPERHRGMGTGGCGQFIPRCLCRPFLLGRGLLTLFSFSSMKSLSWETALHKLFQSESFPQAAALHKLPQHGSFPRSCSPSGTGCSSVGPPQGHKPCQ